MRTTRNMSSNVHDRTLCPVHCHHHYFVSFIPCTSLCCNHFESHSLTRNIYWHAPHPFRPMHFEGVIFLSWPVVKTQNKSCQQTHAFYVFLCYKKREKKNVTSHNPPRSKPLHRPPPPQKKHGVTVNLCILEAQYQRSSNKGTSSNVSALHPHSSSGMVPKKPLFHFVKWPATKSCNLLCVLEKNKYWTYLKIPFLKSPKFKSFLSYSFHLLK